MNSKLKALQQRRVALQDRAALERRNLSLHFEPWQKPLTWADKGIDAVNFIKSNPIVWSTAFAALAHYKPKLASKTLAIGWGALKLLKGAKSIL
ncbi:YqjK-like family protein [Polynucleobacter sp. Latsch14-2]|jgi:hypothetical protein|uniref:YqjK family protein n=1 Tax=Polynucleobacter sp. Latsch14-2 TaxID=2576920 RepID=UPI001C0E8410|nr:YqjK-like family protein [Polynucleobacter sp. Latsch14-2]MBU3614324.1 YqjK-like family protein [Polynucleobacter sp. Latsch14-2]